MWHIKVRIEDIPRHIVWIGGGKSDTIEPLYLAECREEIPKGRLDSLIYPGELFRIPEFFLGLFAVAIDILPEESDLSSPLSDDLTHLSDDLLLTARDLSTTSKRDDTKATKVVTSCLDDDICGAWIGLELLDLEILIKLRIVADMLTIEPREDMREIADFFDPKGKINEVRSQKKSIVIVSDRLTRVDARDMSRSLTTKITRLTSF